MGQPPDMAAGHKDDIVVTSSDPARSHSGSSNAYGTVLSAGEAGPSKNLHRHLTSRQVQVLAIGGTVGGAVFIAMGGALAKGGPGSLFLAYCIQIIFMGMVTNCEAEMTSYMPVSAAFIQHATKWVDESYGFMIGWNYYLYMALGIPFEMVTTSIIMGFWRDDIPILAIIFIMIVLYTGLNVLAVHWWGEFQFWMSLGKIILLLSCFMFTFVTMVGGNPQHDAYGFRYWNTPGAFLEHIGTGPLGRFQGFLACYFQAAYICTGPDYVSVMAGEAVNPRRTIKSGFKTMYIRFLAIFVGSALFIGIVLPANDKQLLAILNGTAPGASTGAASPYVIAAQNMGISVLPSFINALLLTSIISAGNDYTYSASRALYGLAVNGQAPAFLKRCTKRGVPIYCLGISMLFSSIAFLQLSTSSSVVYYGLIGAGTAGGLINFTAMGATYINFYKGLRAQGIDRSTLPYRGWGQPYMAYIVTAWLPLVTLVFGYTSFVGGFDAATFFSYYSFVLLAPLTYGFWKLWKRTSFVKPADMDLVWARPEIDAHEAMVAEQYVGFWREIMQSIRPRRKTDSTVETFKM